MDRVVFLVFLWFISLLTVVFLVFGLNSKPECNCGAICFHCFLKGSPDSILMYLFFFSYICVYIEFVFW